MRTLHMLHSLDVEPLHMASMVRNGFKWADLQYGEKIELCVCTRGEGMVDGTISETHDVQGIGSVRELWFGRFQDIPARLLRWEHEERSREYNGLFESMRKAYGEEFGERNPVVVLTYYRVS